MVKNYENYPCVVKDVVDYLIEIRKKYPDADVEDEVFYSNGNDGTAFDWTCNGSVCEIGFGLKNSDVWAFKMLVSDSGKASVYCYPHGEAQPVEKCEKQILSLEDANRLMATLYTNYDAKGIYDEYFSEIEWVDADFDCVPVAEVYL